MSLSDNFLDFVVDRNAGRVGLRVRMWREGLLVGDTDELPVNDLDGRRDVIAWIYPFGDRVHTARLTDVRAKGADELEADGAGEVEYLITVSPLVVPEQIERLAEWNKAKDGARIREILQQAISERLASPDAPKQRPKPIRGYEVIEVATRAQGSVVLHTAGAIGYHAKRREAEFVPAPGYDQLFGLVTEQIAAVLGAGTPLDEWVEYLRSQDGQKQLSYSAPESVRARSADEAATKWLAGRLRRSPWARV